VSHPIASWVKFSIQNSKGGAGISQAFVKSLPQNACVGVHVPINARKSAFASFYFTIKNWHEKTPEAKRLLGFRCLHLFGQYKLAGVVNLDASTKTRKPCVFKGLGGF
jgi:hypothetical protein